METGRLGGMLENALWPIIWQCRTLEETPFFLMNGLHPKGTFGSHQGVRYPLKLLFHLFLVLTFLRLGNAPCKDGWAQNAPTETLILGSDTIMLRDLTPKRGKVVPNYNLFQRSIHNHSGTGSKLLANCLVIMLNLSCHDSPIVNT